MRKKKNTDTLVNELMALYVTRVCDAHEQLLKAVEDVSLYIQHSSNCATQHGKMRNCDCGLSESLKALQDARHAL